MMTQMLSDRITPVQDKMGQVSPDLLNKLKLFANKKVLVTGGTGLVGRQLVRYLCNLGARVTVVSLDDLVVDDRAKHLKVDLRDQNNCEDLAFCHDYVFHLAGVKGSPVVTKTQPASFFVPMLQFNTNILEACRSAKVKGLLYTSSVGAYAQAKELIETNALAGEPMDTYPGWAKRMAEMQLQTYKIQYGWDNWAVVRLTNCYGQGDNFDPANAMVISALMAKINRGDNPLKIWGNGRQVRDYLYSTDAAMGIMLAMLYGKGELFNLGGNEAVSLRQIVDEMHTFIDFKHEYDDQSQDYNTRTLNTDKARGLLGFMPLVSIADGLRETWSWYLCNPDEHLKKQNYFRTSK